ncbi:hypothetical protein BAOM_4301 [Peribacillus asahii]|uniref:Uncharacterized protein n=1 Tax=Peribacillus asahii TaxID=228899 RepID=A0A3Q9RR43_9BACI|nr:hypothetical protein BAOM_4301 [Peribacillus asahii]
MIWALVSCLYSGLAPLNKQLQTLVFVLPLRAITFVFRSFSFTLSLNLGK